MLTLAAALQVACIAPRAEPAFIRDWPTFAEHQVPGRLLALDAPAGAQISSGAGWHFESGGEQGADVVLCHESGADTVHPLPDSVAVRFDAGVSARPAPGGDERFGLAFWWQTPASFYLARANSRTNNVRLYRRDGDAWALLGARDLAVPVGQWHELTVRTRDSHLVVGLNREPLIEVAVPRAAGGGMGLWAESRTPVCFRRPWLASGAGARMDQVDSGR